VYSHSHVDHIGGASLILKQHPKIEIIAESGTAEFLRERQDPHRPITTRVFKNHETLTPRPWLEAAEQGMAIRDFGTLCGVPSSVSGSDSAVAPA